MNGREKRLGKMEKEARTPEEVEEMAGRLGFRRKSQLDVDCLELGSVVSAQIGRLRGIIVMRRRRRGRQCDCMWQSVPDGGAAHGGARLRFWVAERGHRERKEKKREEERNGLNS